MWILTVVALCLSVSCHAEDNVTWSLTDKVVVITGAARGIGYAIAENFLQNNVSKVIIVDKNQTQGELATSTLNSLYGDDKVEFYWGDITTDLDSISSAIFGNYTVDILVNDAGVLNESDVAYTLGTNAIGTVSWGLRFFKHMRKDHGGIGGTIINVASISGYLRDPFIPIYKSSKYAILGFTYGLGHEYTYNTSGVRVIALCPGFTDTEMTRGQMVVDDQVEIFTKFKNSLVMQTADHVGKCLVDIYKTANTSTAWTVENNEDAKLSPAEQDVTLSDLEALENS